MPKSKNVIAGIQKFMEMIKMDKSDLMKLTNRYKRVDSALPHRWVDDMARNGLQYDSIINWYVWQYQDPPSSGPAHLGEELLLKNITIDGIEITILDLIQEILENRAEVKLM